jgi:hypothetical protein
MRAPESRIQEAILHQDGIVREAAVSYFTGEFTGDVDVTHRVIQAIERFGDDAAFEPYWFLAYLPQDDVTFGWLVDYLRTKHGDAESASSLASGVVTALQNAPVEMLARRESEWSDLELLGEDGRNNIRQRIAAHAMSPEALWKELEAWCAAGGESEDSPDTNRLDWIIDALSRHREFCTPKVLQALESRLKDEWFEYCLIILAGELRLHEAATSLISIKIDSEDVALVEWQNALARIGSDEVVRGLEAAYGAAKVDLRMSIANTLEKIHTDLCLETCLRLYGTETDDEVRRCLIAAAVRQIAREAIEPARQYILAEPPSPDSREIRQELLAACEILDERIPEFEAWRDDSRHDRELNRAWYRAQHLSGGIYDALDDDLELSDDCDDLEDELDPYVEPTDWERPAPIVREGLVGRNDPCPCGSGKKFKKCCLRIQVREEPLEMPARPAQPKYPVGTIARYGPNNSQTTKVVASVILRPGGEPIMKKWFGARVADDPKVRRQINAFFDKQNVQSVVGPRNNLGCPHEEGIEFPLGEDCPHCPYWAGKQGSNRHG